MPNVKQRKNTLMQLGMYFAEKGKILTQDEYIKAEDKPVTFWGIRNVFRNYSRMVVMLKTNEPELVALIGKKEEPKPAPVAPKAAPKPQPKPVVEAAVKPAIKPAVKTEK